jgi:dCMP deaminase
MNYASSRGIVADWDRRFMELATHVGEWSKDKSRKIGCVIVGHRNEIRATGFNGFPRGAKDDQEDRHGRPLKYDWTEHAERNAIYNAAAIGVPLAGCRIYVPWFPCVACARAIVQVGIIEVVAFAPDLTDPQWGAEFEISSQLFSEVDVKVRLLER